MVRKQSKSKRMSLHQKYKVERKVKDHHRKLRKEARNNPLLAHKKLKKDPGIPNLWPLKEEFLQKIQNQKAKIEEEQSKQRDRRQLEAQKRRNIETIAQEANEKIDEFDKKQELFQGEESQASMFNVRDGSRKAYYREFKKLLEVADVILEVLDARDPLGSRCAEIEQKILKKDPNKKIILILNKIDLVPKENVEPWLKYLRNEFPTIAFKSTTQEQKKHLNQSGVSTDLASKNLLSSSECLGADILIQLLKNYCRNLNLKTSISVGIIGYPNVGKSSLINSLKRAKAVGVGATPGFTKTVQEIYLDKNVKLIDCPGIVFATGNNDNDIILRNCVKIEQIPDAIEPVETILKRCKAEQLMQIYKIPVFQNANEFLMHVAKKKGKLGKGGVPNMQATARTVLQDWTGGKIPFYTIPPALKNVHISSEIVSSWGKEFDLDNIILQEQSIISSLPNTDTSDHMAMAPSTSTVAAGFLNDQEMDEDEDAVDEEEEDDEFDETASAMSDINEIEQEIPEPIKTTTKKPTKQKLADAADQINPQINQNRKKLQKQQKKLKKKALAKYGASMEDEDSNDEEVAPKMASKKTVSFKSSKKAKESDDDDSYNFATDFKPTADDDLDLEDL